MDGWWEEMVEKGGPRRPKGRVHKLAGSPWAWPASTHAPDQRPQRAQQPQRAQRAHLRFHGLHGVLTPGALGLELGHVWGQADQGSKMTSSEPCAAARGVLAGTPQPAGEASPSVAFPPKEKERPSDSTFDGLCLYKHSTPTCDEVDVLPADAIVAHLSQHQGHALLALGDIWGTFGGQ